MIVLSRIDDKLIHGQVASSWIRVGGANRIYIVDDATAHDPFLSQIFKSVAPQGTKVEIWDLETALVKVKLVEEHEKIKGFILTKGPHEYLEMAKAGINFDRIVVGNMSSGDGKVQIHSGHNCYVSETDKAELRELANMGIDVKLHMIPDGVKIPILETSAMKG